MIRNDDLAGMASTQVNYATEKLQPFACTADAKLIATCILMAAHLIVDAIETASKEL